MKGQPFVPRVIYGGLARTEQAASALVERFGRSDQMDEHISYADLEAYLDGQGFPPEAARAAAQRWHGHD